MKPGTLYLIPVPLGEAGSPVMIPPHYQAEVQALTRFIVEEGKSGRRWLRELAIRPLRELTLEQWNEHSQLEDGERILAPLRDGESMGLLSDCGVPALADPGEELVAIAHRWGARVVPIPGTSSILLALIGSGLNGESFRYNGYLPKKGEERKRAIAALGRAARSDTQIVIETPYRASELLAEFLAQLEADLYLCRATNLTTPQESISTRTIAEWRDARVADAKAPTVFVLGLPRRKG